LSLTYPNYEEVSHIFRRPSLPATGTAAARLCQLRTGRGSPFFFAVEMVLKIGATLCICAFLDEIRKMYNSVFNLILILRDQFHNIRSSKVAR